MLIQNQSMDADIFWIGALGSIAIVSWFFYRFFTPRECREWARAGIVQAFVISFYAEMYGFPVTFYFLARFFGLDLRGTFWDGNLWVYLTGYPDAMLVSMTIGYLVAAFGVLLIVAGWREVYRAHAENRLATEGLYAFMRHPQYTGIFVVLLGEGVIHWPTVFSLAAIPVLILVYVLLACSEERRILAEFGESYREYQRRVPMFVPRTRKGLVHAIIASARQSGARPTIHEQ